MVTFGCTDDDRGRWSVRVLVVEDYEPFRRFLCSNLRKRPGFLIVGEASDGIEAVREAEGLQPDLILLDIGLPSVNGIEAARRIRKLSPDSKIIFVSQESSAEVVQEALSTGAAAYVVKTSVASSLWPALEAVRLGRRLVSPGLAGHHFTDASDSQALDRLCPMPALPPRLPTKMEITRSHQVEFYSDDAAFVVGFSCFIEAALRSGGAVIVVATESHRTSLFQRLQEHGVDVVAVIEQGRYRSLDVADTLSTFMENDLHDLPDSVRFLQIVGDLITAAAQATAGERSRVAICGECASILWAEGKADAAIRVEQLCNKVAKRDGIDILCGFSLSSFYREEDKQTFQKICSSDY
jgi:DNA-binding NarL/FixJ family response regulator